VKNRLKELRKTRTMSQAELARALEISRQAVNGFESGKYTPSLEMAFKIARLFDLAIEEIFLYQEQNSMQTLIENLTQWLPKGERFTDKALNAIALAQQQAALQKRSQVEPRDLLYGLLRTTQAPPFEGGDASLQDSTTTAARLLRDCGLTLAISDRDNKQNKNASKINKFSPASQYILELALQTARLKQQKYIETEHLLLGLVQLTQTGNRDLIDLFQQYEVDISTLSKKVTEII
jgi:putative transcriptional regulator